jgi:hypothetical protein
LPVGEQAISLPPYAGSTDGLAYLAPNPVEEFQGYACRKGELSLIAKITEELGAETISGVKVPGMTVAGFEYLVPKPVPEVHVYADMKGVALWPTKIAEPLAAKTALSTATAGGDAGAEYNVPHPAAVV